MERLNYQRQLLVNGKPLTNDLHSGSEYAQESPTSITPRPISFGHNSICDQQPPEQAPQWIRSFKPRPGPNGLQ
jgi:hypothetical protein